MSANTLLWLVAGGWIATCFAAIGARTLRHFSRHALEELCERRDARDRFGDILRLHDRVARGVETLVAFLTSLVLIGGAYWAVLAASQMPKPVIPAENPWLLFGLLVLAGGVFMAAAKLWVPWSIERLWAAGFVYHTWRLWHALSLAMAPSDWVAQMIDGLFHRIAGRRPETSNGDTFEDEIRSIVTEGHREGLLEEDAREMIEGVIELGDADVSEIMTPRTDMHMLHVGMSWERMLEYVIKVGHTRIPVFEKSRDDIIGILYSKDLLPELARAGSIPRHELQEILRPAYFVPETKAVDDLLQEFQKTRNHMAIVLDEYGGVSGLVTIEDVLEEIVGEIIDEYDEELVEEIRMIDSTTWEALGRAHIDEINEEMDLDLPDDGDFDTIGGFVFSEMGRVPTAGDSMVYDDRIRITVLEATRRRIERLRIERLNEAKRVIA